MSVKQIAKLRHHLLHLTDRGATADALMAKMRRTNAVFLGQEHLRIAKTACGGDPRAIAGTAQATQQTRLSTTLQRGMNSQDIHWLQDHGGNPRPVRSRGMGGGDLAGSLAADQGCGQGGEPL